MHGCTWRRLSRQLRRKTREDPTQLKASMRFAAEPVQVLWTDVPALSTDVVAVPEKTQSVPVGLGFRVFGMCVCVRVSQSGRGVARGDSVPRSAPAGGVRARARVVGRNPSAECLSSEYECYIGKGGRRLSGLVHARAVFGKQRAGGGVVGIQWLGNRMDGRAGERRLSPSRRVLGSWSWDWGQHRRFIKGGSEWGRGGVSFATVRFLGPLCSLQRCQQWTGWRLEMCRSICSRCASV
ncbi:hypothetical protein OF83DRAFT_522060 [Amylostereum chailletii]|nr:hypothetical protein OF83DRAFT_522060 [Amylostereum chailletii]